MFILQFSDQSSSYWTKIVLSLKTSRLTEIKVIDTENIRKFELDQNILLDFTVMEV